jgi:hypothetical protein
VTAAHSSAGVAASGAAGGGTDAALAEVTRVLASYQTPRMPSWLGARLDQALAAEAVRGSGGRGSWPGGQRLSRLSGAVARG